MPHGRPLWPACRTAVVLVGGLLVLLVAVPSASAQGTSSAAAQDLGVPVGFGREARGGAGGPEVWVTSLADSGPGTLREALSAPGPRWVRFAVSGTLRLERKIKVPSDITVDGRDAEVTITNKGLVLQGVSNVILVNLRITGITGSTDDAIQVVDGARHVWIDHCDLSAGSDGLIDITRGATDVTVSYNRFSNHDKVMLIDNNHYPNDPTRVTIHHNLFDGTHQRHPRGVYATIHAYNNYLRGWTGYGMQSAEGATLYSQHNIYAAGPDPDAAISRGQSLGALRSDGDLLLGGAHILDRDPHTVHDPASHYPYTPEPATTALATTLTTTTGPQPPQPAPRPAQPSELPEPQPIPQPAPSAPQGGRWTPALLAIIAGIALVGMAGMFALRQSRS